MLRLCFGRWGRPLHLKVDNGNPWAVTGRLPSVLELWLCGLGVGLIRNRPYRPQENGVVERSQGTTKRWAAPQSCHSVEELQAVVDREDRIQREEYPALQGRSRREVYPELLHSGRGYAPGWDSVCWDLALVGQRLAKVKVGRKVSADGKVSLYNRWYHVSRSHRGQPVCVTFDPNSGEWVFSSRSGQELRRRPAVEFNRERILALNISRTH